MTRLNKDKKEFIVICKDPELSKRGDFKNKLLLNSHGNSIAIYLNDGKFKASLLTRYIYSNLSEIREIYSSKSVKEKREFIDPIIEEKFELIEVSNLKIQYSKYVR